MFLLDTNVVSELRKVPSGRANRNVARWGSVVPIESLFLSVIVIEELEIGILAIERRDGVSGARLRRWLTDRIMPTFANRILPVDLAVACCSARLHVPDPQPVRDALIAATALTHGLVVATRNVADFGSTGAATFNPWTA